LCAGSNRNKTGHSTPSPPVVYREHPQTIMQARANIRILAHKSLEM
jgi:hypothetical protein